MRFLVLAASLVTAPALGQEAPAQPCARFAAFAPTKAPDLQGLWDFVMDAGPQLSRGYMAIGPIDGGWAGSLTPYSNNSLAIRSVTVDGTAVKLVVASREADVTFTGQLVEGGTMMCGTVAYHGGRIFPMIARHRPHLVYRPAG
ncbi:hypothetical protein HJG53_10850 [Sphingomonas sp. ID1715]|uniref:hypothetical protein n=1 Tax=Sphingomonas sp. ID1715 TaxID=1656898 RepID=UPI001487676C|nr:hypothetical protein [Sphingomonas sp. ID1715]NNM77403.1 hypothetical protein [Sphingomonas sp. ID1715]